MIIFRKKQLKRAQTMHTQAILCSKHSLWMILRSSLMITNQKKKGSSLNIFIPRESPLATTCILAWWISFNRKAKNLPHNLLVCIKIEGLDPTQ